MAQKAVILVVMAYCFFAGVVHGQGKETLWVLDETGGVYGYDVGTWDLEHKIHLGNHLHGICVLGDQETIVVSHMNAKSGRGELVWIDTRDGQILDLLEVGDFPDEIECSQDGKWIYVACWDGSWWVIDGHKKKLFKKIRTAGLPHNTTISPDGARMFLSPLGEPGRITVIDLQHGHEPVGVISMDGSPRPASFSGDGKYLYSQVDGLAGFQVVDASKLEVICTVEHSIDKDSRCHGLSVRPQSTEVWSCASHQSLIFITEWTSSRETPLGQVETPGHPYWISFSSGGDYAFISLVPDRKLLKKLVLVSFFVGFCGIVVLVVRFLRLGRRFPFLRSVNLARHALIWTLVWLIVACGGYLYRETVQGGLLVIDCNSRKVVANLDVGRIPKRSQVSGGRLGSSSLETLRQLEQQ